MASNNGASLLPIEDYEAIEAAVKETARGRWFLEEFARRNRHAETEAIVAQIERLEKTVKNDRAVPDIDRIRLDLADMAEAIVRTKHEIASIKHEGDEGSRFQQASNELDAIVMQTEGATNDILLNAEKIQELAWTLRENGADGEVCDGLEMASTDIYTACSFQDLTGQRTRKVVTVLRYLESRINAMMAIWGFEGLMDSGLPLHMPTHDHEDKRPDAHLLNGPALIGQGMDQNSIDDLLIDNAHHVSQSEADDMFGSAEVEEDETVLDLPDVSDTDSHVYANDGLAVSAAGDNILADDLEMVGGADDYAAEAEVDADVFTPASEEAVDEDAVLDLRRADVFASEPAVVVEPAAPTIVRQRVGNTVQEVEVTAEVLEEASPVLAVVANADPIAAMTPARRLVAFGQ